MKVSDHCFAITGLYYITPWNVNSGFIVGNKKTLVVDSGSNYLSAQTIYGYAAAVKPENEIILLNTEKHLDHIGGNEYFSEKGVSIYGHSTIKRDQKEFDQMVNEINPLISNTARRQNHEERIAFQNTRIVNPDHIIDRDVEFDLGDIQARILLTSGHTKSNISVYVPKDKVLYCGDMILRDIIPNLEEGNVFDWRIWLDSLGIIDEIDIEVVIPGHGGVIQSEADVKREVERMKNILNNAINKGKAPTE